MKKYFFWLGICVMLLTISCASQAPAEAEYPAGTGNGVPLDEAIADIASYYAATLPANAKIALTGFEAEARLLSDYIFEELWIHFEDRASFTLVDRQNLELIRKELEYQYSGAVSDESAQSIGNQFG
ncbi:MAG: hypothetical protein LBK05_05700, partial [Treponema sp.]|nr:hypothetical protein [Treponema sp.]